MLLYTYMHMHVCACIITVMQKDKEKYLTTFRLERNFRSHDSVGGTSLLHPSNTMQFTNELGLWRGKIKTDSSLHL